MFRVRQCTCCFIFECLFFILMLVLITLAFLQIGTEIESVETLLRENVILHEQQDYLPFLQCKYREPSAFNIKACAENEDGFDFIMRSQELAERNRLCMDRIELIPCSFHNTITFNYTRLKNFTQCAGLNQIRLKRHITQYTPIIAPSVNIAAYKGKILRVKDFLVRCPKCGIRSFFGWRAAASGGKCAREIQTYEFGWPQHARFCDQEDIHDETDFCRLYEATENVLKGKRFIAEEEENVTAPSWMEEMRMRGQISYIRNLN